MIRIAMALTIIASAALVAALFPDARVAAVLVGGFAAVFAVATAPSDGSPRSERVAAPAMPMSEQAIIDALSEPVLLVIDGRVRIANAAARTLLGAHIIGEDVRLAIRHPAAAERLAMGSADGSTELVGLGGRDQRVAMQVATIERSIGLPSFWKATVHAIPM